MSSHKHSDAVQKNFVSEIDRFLHDFDKKHPEKSLSQKKEIAKFKRIYRIRDKVSASVKSIKKLWEGF